MATEFFIFDLDFDLESFPILASENFKTTRRYCRIYQHICRENVIPLIDTCN